MKKVWDISNIDVSFAEEKVKQMDTAIFAFLKCQELHSRPCSVGCDSITETGARATLTSLALVSQTV